MVHFSNHGEKFSRNRSCWIGICFVDAVCTYDIFVTRKNIYLAVGYVILFLNMFVILKVLLIPTEVELYSVKMSALLWPLFILAMVLLYVLGELYIKRQYDEAGCITQFKILLKKELICIAIGVVLVVSQLLTGTIVEPTNVITKILYYIQAAFHSNIGVYWQRKLLRK